MMNFSFLIRTKLPPPHQFQRFQCSPRTLRTLPPRAAVVGWRGRPTGTHHNHADDQSQQWSPAWREQHPMFEFDLCMDVGSNRRHFQNGSGFLPNCKILSWKWSNDSGHLHTLHDCLEVSAGNRLAIVCSNMQRNHIRVHFSKIGYFWWLKDPFLRTAVDIRHKACQTCLGFDNAQLHCSDLGWTCFHGMTQQ